LVVSSGARTSRPMNFPFSEEPLSGLKALPGVKIVDLYRLIRSNYQGKPIVIESFSSRESAKIITLLMGSSDGIRALSARGDGTGARRDMGEGKGVIISESFQSKFGQDVNDKIELTTPSGKIAFRVLGVYVDYSSDVGSVLIDRALYKQYWRDELVDAFDL